MKLKDIICGMAVGMVALTGLTGCDTDAEPLEIQKLKTYDPMYYENLRAFKNSPHEISYAYYAAWAPLEGQAGYKDPASWGERFLGLPDSLDIVNLWMGIPTPDAHPVAYEDMVYCQQVKGTRFVFHADASHFGHQFYDREYNESTGAFDYVYDEAGNHVIVTTSAGDLHALQSYARWACDTVVKTGLDGVDFDYEGWDSNSMIRVAEECNKYFGPEGKWAEKLFIVDYFNGAPDVEIDQYCDYLVRQAYTWQIGFQTGAGGHAYEKTVFCDSFGAEAGENGINGAQIREYAQWEPSEGRKGGCGAFYLDYNYKSKSGIPYNEFRQAIQIMNPAVE